MSEHLLLSVAMSSPSALHSPCALIHLPPLPIEAWETSVVAAADAAAAIFWQLLMDAGNTNERFNDSQAVLVSAMITYIFSIYQRKFAPFAHSKEMKTLADKKCKVWYTQFFKYFFVQRILCCMLCRELLGNQFPHTIFSQMTFRFISIQLYYYQSFGVYILNFFNW